MYKLTYGDTTLTYTGAAISDWDLPKLQDNVCVQFNFNDGSSETFSGLKVHYFFLISPRKTKGKQPRMVMVKTRIGL